MVTTLLGAYAFGKKTITEEMSGKRDRKVWVTERLANLDRIYRNAFRQTSEYDRGSESKDTLLWSKEKSGAEALKTYKALLYDRKALRKMSDMKEIAYQGRIRGWSMVIPEDENGYETLLEAGSQVGHVYPEVYAFLKEEVKRALDLGFSPEAYALAARNAEEEGFHGAKEYLHSVLPLFESYPEKYKLQMDLLVLDYNRLAADKEAAIKEHRAEEWIKESDKLDKRLENLIEPFRKNGFDLQEAMQSTDIQQLYTPYLNAEITDLDKGIVTVSISGIAKGDWRLALDGKEIKTYHLSEKALLSETATAVLPRVGHHTVELSVSTGSDTPLRVTLRNEKADANHYKGEEGDFVFAYALTDGHPIEGVKVEVFDTSDRREKALSTLKIGADGRVLITPHPKSGETYLVVASHPDMLEDRRFYIYEPQVSQPFTVTEWRDELLFYPDRSIYRRGQEIKVGLVYRSTRGGEEARLLRQKEGAVTLYARMNGDEIIAGKAKFATDDNGVAQIAFDIPQDPSYTDFYLRSDTNDSRSIEVEDYKLSYLSVRIDSIPTGYTQGHPMKVYGRTEDINGHGVPADVELSARDSGTHRYSAKSDARGRFVIETDTVPAYWGVSVEVKATDALGNVATDSRYLHGYKVSLPLNPREMIAPSEKKSITLSTKSQPYQSLPLGDMSQYHIIASLVDKDGNIHTLGELPTKGEETFARTDLPSGMYTLRLESTDFFGTLIREEAGGLYLYDDKDTRFYGDTVLFTHKKDDGTILLASSKPLFAQIQYRMRSGASSTEVKSLVPGNLYRLSSSKEKAIADIFAVWQGTPYHTYLGRDKDGNEEYKDQTPEIKVLGLEDGIVFRPGSRFSKEILVTDSVGKPMPAGIPVLVSIYDSALDAAGGELDWRDAVLPPLSPFAEGLYGYSYGVPMPMSLSINSRASFDGVLEESVTVSDSSSSSSSPAKSRGTVRKNFVETAYFSALLRTDMRGRVKLNFKLPDTQTTFRIKMYAFRPDLTEDAKSTQDLKVEQPLSIDLSLPRFLRVGDKLFGKARIQSLLGMDETEAEYGISDGNSPEKGGSVRVAKGSVSSVPFEVVALAADSLTLKAWVMAEGEKDVIERTIPVKPNTEKYNVAVPITVFGKNGVTLSLPKAEHRTETPAFVELYASPLHLLLSELAKEYDKNEKIQDLSLIALSSKFATLAEISEILDKDPLLRKTLAQSACDLKAYDDMPEKHLARQASPGELSRFYAFIADGRRVREQMQAYETELLRYASPQGGFYFTKEYPSPSVWLTHILLRNLAEAQDYFSPEMTKTAKDGLMFLRRSLSDKSLLYRDFIALEMLLHDYGENPLKGLSLDGQKAYDIQVKDLRQNYQMSSTSRLLEYARYAKVFDKKKYPEVVKFVKDRIPYAESDMDRLLFELFLADDSGELRPEVVRFFMQLKQGTMWDHPLYLDAVAILLRNLATEDFDKNALLKAGQEVHSFTPLEKATGHILFPLYNIPDSGSLEISWQGVKTSAVMGGVRYEVEQPISEITPTGKKLTVRKEIYARRIENGKSTLVRLTDESHAQAGEQVIVRYLIESLQDLSLVTLFDRRAAGLEPGYDFRGYGTSDRLWWSYSRRDDADYVFIDYLPKGKHVLELEVVANVGGSFAYGPVSVQSYYAPEFAGNSAGGFFVTDPSF